MKPEGIPTINTKSPQEESIEAQERVNRLKLEIEKIKGEQEKINEGHDIVLIHKRRELKAAKEKLAEVSSKQKSTAKEKKVTNKNKELRKNALSLLKEEIDQGSGTEASSLRSHPPIDRGRIVEPKKDLDWHDKHDK